MKIQLFLLFVLSMTLALMPSCQDKGESTAPAPTLSLQQQDFRRSSDGCPEEKSCAVFEAHYPLVEQNHPAAVAINDSIRYQVRLSTAVFAPYPEDVPATLDSVATAFFEEYQLALADEPDFMQGWDVVLQGKALYRNDTLLVVELETSAYAGGAHPNSFVTLLMFETRTGERLSLTDLYPDTAGLRQIAEIKFREARGLQAGQSLDEAGFFWGEGFQLPENAAPTEQGLYFYYNPYEAAAYSLGPTSFTIGYDALADLKRE